MAVRSHGLSITLIMSCMFGANGVAMPFLPQWLAQECGLIGVQIGVVLSAAQLARIGIGPVIATWADGFADRRSPIRLLTFGALISYVGFFLSRDFAALLFTGFCALGLSAAATPLIEAAALRAARAGGVAFGASRAIGSLAFIVGNLAGGALVAWFGLGAALGWIVASVSGGFAAALLVMRADPAPASRSGFRARLRQAGPLLRNRRFALALIATGLTQASHAFYYGFSTLAWTAQGLGPEIIGALWAVSVGAEVLFLLTLRHSESRVGPETLVVIGAAAAALRWSVMAFSPPLWLLWLIQLLHAATFAATHVGALRIVERETPPEIAGLGMTLYAALAAGTPMGLATIMSGFLFDEIGAGGYGAMAILGAAGLIAAIAMTRASGEYSPVKSTF